ncbi:hypothetical protein F441_14608, partial [Phytophthora nicotianae CJ01A1]
SLVVTTCNDRGFPIVDFMCLNENAVTTSSILEYFKEKNPEWKDVKSVVIDKDFVEWQVLEQTFPNAQISRKEKRVLRLFREKLAFLSHYVVELRTWETLCRWEYDH